MCRDLASGRAEPNLGPKTCTGVAAASAQRRETGPNVQGAPHTCAQSLLHLDSRGGDDDVTASIRPSGISRFQLVLEKESGVLGS